MRKPLTKTLLDETLKALSRETHGEGSVYLTGGASAVVEGWRDATLDIDLKIDPEPQGIFKAIRSVKRSKKVNIELVSPSDFIPQISGWRERSIWIDRYGSLDVFHYDFTSQALSKIERGHDQDIADVHNMLAGRYVSPNELSCGFNLIRDRLIYYPRLIEEHFEQRLQEALTLWEQQQGDQSET